MMAQSIQTALKAYSISEQFTLVNQAINDILIGGQSYRIGSRQLNRANLTELKNLRSELYAELENEDAEGLIAGVGVAVFDGR